MGDSVIDISIKNSIATVRINDSAKLNALSVSLVSEMETVMQSIVEDDNIRVTIITGTGRSFIAGADISYVKDLMPRKMRNYAHKVSGLNNLIYKSGKVFIAAINGFCLGGGLELALSCDIRIASKKAMFGFPEVTLGIIPGAQGTQLCTRLIGSARAKDIILSGRVFGAEEAENLGLLNYLVDPEELMGKAFCVADGMLKAAPIAQAYAKECINVCYETSFTQGCVFENHALEFCCATEDRTEGMNAFVEKRPPVFRGK